MPGLSEQLDIGLRFALPYLAIFLLFILNTVSFSGPLYATIELPFVLMVLYYWSIYRPTLIPPFLVFVMGVCLDALSGWPIGLSSFVFLLLRQTIMDQRAFLTGQPFMVVWLGYMIVSGSALVLQWLLFGLIQFSWSSFLPVALMIGCGTFVFPAVALILHLTHRVLPVIQDQYTAVK